MVFAGSRTQNPPWATKWWFKVTSIRVSGRAVRGQFQRDTSRTQAPNHMHGCAMISRQPVRLSGAGQGFGTQRVDHGEMAREKAAAPAPFRAFPEALANGTIVNPDSLDGDEIFCRHLRPQRPPPRPPDAARRSHARDHRPCSVARVALSAPLRKGYAP